MVMGNFIVAGERAEKKALEEGKSAEEAREIGHQTEMELHKEGLKNVVKYGPRLLGWISKN